jgi:hypothetical protein
MTASDFPDALLDCIVNLEIEPCLAKQHHEQSIATVAFLTPRRHQDSEKLSAVQYSSSLSLCVIASSTQT